MPGAPVAELLNRRGGRSQVGPAPHKLFQPLQPGLEAGIVGLEVSVLLLQRLDGDHQDARHVAGVDGRRRTDRPYAIIAKGGEEILGHRSVVAELLGVMACLLPY